MLSALIYITPVFVLVVALVGGGSYPEKNLRAYPGTVRDSQEWISTYKVRAVVEKSINHFKDCFCLEDLKTRNEKTLHFDLLFAGISQLITVLVADRIHAHQFIRSLKPLVA